jgi:hypothetical protein
MRGPARAARLALGFAAFCARLVTAEPAAAEPAAAAAEPATAEPAAAEPPLATAEPAPDDLQSTAQRSTRYAAYTVPAGTWSLDVGAFGISGGDAFAKLGAAYGLGAGFEVEMNMAHVSVGLLNVSAAWHFIETRHFDLGVRAGFWYGRGEWFWIAQGAAKSLVSKVDVVSVPIALTASAPLTPWLQLDLGVQYTYGDAFGVTDGDRSILEDAQIGIRQLFFRPGVRVFLSDNTALELFAKLPAVTDVPTSRAATTLPFSKTWTIEAGLRSRLADGLFGNLRLHYGDVSDAVYGAALYPSFDIEFRL